MGWIKQMKIIKQFRDLTKQEKQIFIFKIVFASVTMYNDTLAWNQGINKILVMKLANKIPW